MENTNEKSVLCYACKHKNICKYVVEVMGMEDALKELAAQYNIPIISQHIVCEKREVAPTVKTI